ncbi:MAG: class I SAM-dependent methyltransferase [Blastocatellia bacterium]|nr:class I SAM-dependent methyltransferase [Blastocatellia bacterium]
MNDIYNLEFLRTLFDQMSGSYDRVNYITSFGFSNRWRRQFVERAMIEPGQTVCDLMCGRGECFTHIAARMGREGLLLAIDFSPGMLDGARQRREKLADYKITVKEGNAVSTGIEDASVDRIVVGFGLKTLSDDLRLAFLRELYRVLRAGGMVSLIEMSEPKAKLLRSLYMHYLKRGVPLIGRLLIGNPENYRMLGVYTERFGGCQRVIEEVRTAGFEAEMVHYFFGCATGIIARKPPRESAS